MVRFGHLDDAAVHLVVLAPPAPEGVWKAVDLLEVLLVEGDHAAEVPASVRTNAVFGRDFRQGDCLAMALRVGAMLVAVRM